MQESSTRRKSQAYWVCSVGQFLQLFGCAVQPIRSAAYKLLLLYFASFNTYRLQLLLASCSCWLAVLCSRSAAAASSSEQTHYVMHQSTSTQCTQGPEVQQAHFYCIQRSMAVLGEKKPRALPSDNIKQSHFRTPPLRISSSSPSRCCSGSLA